MVPAVSFRNSSHELFLYKWEKLTILGREPLRHMSQKKEMLTSPKGSVLVFSLIILSFLLVSALSVATLAVTERRTSGSTDRSGRSFQVADSGVEIVLQKIYKSGYATPNTVKIRDFFGAGICADNADGAGVVSGTVSASNSYEVSFKDNDGNLLGCGALRGDIVKLRSKGTSGNTTRVVEAGVTYTP